MKKLVASTTIAASIVGGGMAALVLGPAFAGAQDEQTDESTETPEGTTEATPESTDRASWLDDVLDGLVADGTIDQTQADAIAAAIEAARPERGDGFGFGHGGPGGFGGFGLSDTLTDVLGLDAEALRTALADGQTLAEIAAANGVDVQAVIDALSAALNAHIDEALAEGRIDEAEATEKRAEVAERVTALVNGELSFEGRGPGFGGFGGHHGRDDDGTEDDSTEDSEGEGTTEGSSTGSA